MKNSKKNFQKTTLKYAYANVFKYIMLFQINMIFHAKSNPTPRGHRKGTATEDLG